MLAAGSRWYNSGGTGDTSNRAAFRSQIRTFIQFRSFFFLKHPALKIDSSRTDGSLISRHALRWLSRETSSETVLFTVLECHEMGALGPADLQLVFECLNGALSQNSAIQKQAEAALHSLEARPGFCSCLAVCGRRQSSDSWVEGPHLSRHCSSRRCASQGSSPFERQQPAVNLRHHLPAGDYRQQGRQPQRPLAGRGTLQEQCE
jgi:hypothetical protein